MNAVHPSSFRFHTCVMMGQSTEDIEAKLAAFVDGELDAAGIEEIQKHLLANPQHRKLLDDLMQGRELLRDLPRETAPPEIFESIQGHLERRLLLDEESALVASTSPSPLRKYMAVAAVLLLTGTLGLVIYSVLPNSKQGTDLAVALERAETTTTETAAAPEARVGGNPRVGLDQPVADAALRDRALSAAADAIAGEAPAVASGDSMGRSAEPEVARPAAVGAVAAAAPPSAIIGEETAPVIVLASDDLAATEKDVSTVLLDNRVLFEQVPMNTPAARRVADAGSLETDADKKLSRTGESIYVARKLTRAQFQAIEQALRSPSRARKQELAQEAQQQYQAYRQSPAGHLGGQVGGEFAGARAPADFARGNEMAKSVQEAAANEASTQPTIDSGYIATQPTTQRSDVIAVGDKLKIDLPSMMQSNVGGGQTVEVTPDGAVQVPPLEPVPAAGLTTDQLREKLATMLGEGKAGPAGPITISKEFNDEPLTDMVIVVRSADETLDETAATRPATQPAAADTFPPAGPTTAPVERLDVAPATTSPATQPGR